MLEHEDLKWIAGTCTELNSVLQQIARYADLARRHKGEHHYVDLLVQRVDLAGRTAQALFDRVTSTILAKTAAKTAAPTAEWQQAFSVVPPAARLFPARVAETEDASVNEKKSKSTLGGQPPPSREVRRSQWTWSAGVGLPPEINVLNPKGNREYILFVDDDPEIAALAAEMLADEGYKVIRAKDGFEALEIYRKIGKQIGLVILDFFLPVMDGDAVFDELRALNQKVNVVLSSGFAEQSKINAMLKQGLHGFIPKPYTREKLLAQVRSTLDAARQALH
jgi:CheY-like chemotaxis protein